MRYWSRLPRLRSTNYSLPVRTTKDFLKVFRPTARCAAIAPYSRTVPFSQIATSELPSDSQDAVNFRQSGAVPLDHDGGLSESAVSESHQSPLKRQLPVSCPGCGALAQEIESTEPGFYTRSRRVVRAWLRPRKSAQRSLETEQGEEQSDDTPPATLEHEDTQISVSTPTQEAHSPVCDRCHDLLYNFRGTSIAHPSIEDIADSIAESPFSRNHVYHVLDAADFPMSLEPRIISQLSLAKPRTRNRRSQHSYSYKPTLSFIITRSDLLAPTKEKVDSLMPYFQTTLRTALGRVGEKLRLGNIHLVSAKRGWWTKEIKDEVWKRGGGNWMVGKFNVGKSNLFEVLFPKGSGDRAPNYAALVKEQSANSKAPQPEILSETSLLPPPQPESPFPALPIVSNLPGTTASPIRLPFGNGKGELIDLPGLERSNLDEFVQAEHKLDVVMTSRPTVDQHTIKPGQSLLLGGGLIRITPALDPDDPSTTMQAYPFVPIDAHVTSTEKAVGTQEQIRESGLKSILAENVGAAFKSAGSYVLETDVTTRHAGPVLRAGMAANRLPFRIYSTDILIQGIGWVELVCQIRKRKKPADLWESPAGAQDDHLPDTEPTTSFKPYASALGTSRDVEESPILPAVEVFTPNGKHISKRIPLGAWTLWKEGGGKHPRIAASVRPRQSIKAGKERKRTAVQPAA